jgi:hypothetical protein
MMSEKLESKERVLIWELRDRKGEWHACIKSSRFRSAFPAQYFVTPPFTDIPLDSAFQNAGGISSHLDDVEKWQKRFMQLKRCVHAGSVSVSIGSTFATIMYFRFRCAWTLPGRILALC